MRVSAFVEAALYEPDAGFYMAGGRAGGARGDFLTAPEVGPLFGTVLGRALDEWWAAAGRPAPFVVHEWGAGPGTLVRAVLAAEPEIVAAGALRWVAIEISASQRHAHPAHPLVESAAAPPSGERPLVVLANELLDNLPFDVYERTADGWREQHVVEEDGGFVLRLDDRADPADPAAEALERLAPAAPVGSTVPWQAAAREWVAARVASLARGGRLVVFDYGGSSDELATRQGGWLRTHRAHDDTRSWLEDPGSCDITTDVAFDQIQLDHRAAVDRSQAEFLRAHGIDELVQEGREIWAAGAHIGDLAAMRARSRVREAEALTDPLGMGRFRVLEWK